MKRIPSHQNIYRKIRLTDAVFFTCLLCGLAIWIGYAQSRFQCTNKLVLAVEQNDTNTALAMLK